MIFVLILPLVKQKSDQVKIKPAWMLRTRCSDIVLSQKSTHPPVN